MASTLTELHAAVTGAIQSLEDGKHADMSSAQKQVVSTAALDLIAVLGCLDKDLTEAKSLEARLEAAGTSVRPLRLPHSRACGWKAHPHGKSCSTNCPTCGGKAV